VSEFGRGYATCLFQFVMHEARLVEDLRIYAKVGMNESSAVEMWANGSSDHLYDLVTGPRISPALRSLANELARVALECGHGFTNKTWYASDAEAWIALAKSLLIGVGDPQTIDEAMDADRRLGLRPELGITCVTQLRR
jgi:hypothetical protein